MKQWTKRKRSKKASHLARFYNPEEFTALKKVFPYFNATCPPSSSLVFNPALRTVVFLLSTPLPLVSFSSGQLWPHLLPAWRGVSSNRQPTCTTASWDTLLKTERTAGGTQRNGKVLKSRRKYGDIEGHL